MRSWERNEFLNFKSAKNKQRLHKVFAVVRARSCLELLDYVILESKRKKSALVCSGTSLFNNFQFKVLRFVAARVIK